MSRLLAAAALAMVAGCSTPVPPPPGAPADPVTVEAPPPTVETIDTPEWIEIPRLGVVDDIVPVELAPDRTMSVPPVDSIGWYALGVLVGEPGPAVLPGHVNWDGVPGAFQRLSSLAPGDSILVRGDGDEQLQFEVYRIDTVAKAEFDTRLVYGDTDGPELRLVTCSGQVVNRSYLDNTVVSARLVAA